MFINHKEKNATCETYQDFMELWHQIKLSSALNRLSGTAFQNAIVEKEIHVCLLHTFISDVCVGG